MENKAGTAAVSLQCQTGDEGSQRILFTDKTVTHKYVDLKLKRQSCGSVAATSYYGFNLGQIFLFFYSANKLKVFRF